MPLPVTASTIDLAAPATVSYADDAVWFEPTPVPAAVKSSSVPPLPSGARGAIFVDCASVSGVVAGVRAHLKKARLGLGDARLAGLEAAVAHLGVRIVALLNAVPARAQPRLAVA